MITADDFLDKTFGLSGCTDLPYALMLQRTGQLQDTEQFSNEQSMPLMFLGIIQNSFLAVSSLHSHIIEVGLTY